MGLRRNLTAVTAAALALSIVAGACSRTASETEDDSHICEGFVKLQNECFDGGTSSYDIEECEQERATHSESWPECDDVFDAALECAGSLDCETWDALSPYTEAPEGTLCLTEVLALHECKD